MTPTEMLNRALMRIGALPVQNILDEAAAQHREVYTGVIERLAAAPFSFFKQTRRLARLSAAPDPQHYRYAFRLPADRVGAVRAVFADAGQRLPVTDYDIQGDTLLTDHEQIWVIGPFVVGPERWPGDFRELFTIALMAELSLSVREDRSLHDRLYVKAFGTPGQDGAGGLFAEAIISDNQALPSEPMGATFANPLIDVR